MTRPEMGRKYILDGSIVVHCCDVDELDKSASVGVPDEKHLIWERWLVSRERLSEITKGQNATVKD